MGGTTELKIGIDACLEVANIADGTFNPLSGFMGGADYRTVIEEMHLRDGHPWTIPITLEVPEERVAEVKQSDLLELIDPTGQRLAELAVEDVYEVDLENDLPKV